jgi:hypothetical protein
MSKRLEKFVKDNREDFDAFEPGPAVWHNIQQQLARQPKKKGVYISMRVLRWAAAAAVIISVGVVGLHYMNKQEQSIATTQPTNALPKLPVTDTNTQPATIIPNNENATIKELLADNITEIRETSSKEKTSKKNPSFYDKDLKAYEQSSQFFSQLIVNKQAELSGLEKTNPSLYKAFVNDINDLNVSYKSLKKQLPQTQDRSRLIKAMINNLQLQIDLLNKQLIIVNQIESKQKVTNYERTI